MSRVDRDTILSLVPHQGRMCLWDEVLEWEAGRIVLQTGAHRDPAHPLRSGGVLHALHLCEYGAQAMAVHGGLLARAQGGRAADGMLVALRDVALQLARIDDLAGLLRGEAELLLAATGSQQYGFRILHDGREIASGRAAAMLSP